MKVADIGALLLLAAIWGASYLFIRVASPVLGPFFLMDARVLLAALALVGYAAATGRRAQVRRRWRAYMILGAINGAAPFALIALAELRLTASLTSILMAVVPIFTALVAAFWLRESLTLGKIAGLGMGIVGVIILVGWSPVPLSLPVLLSVGALLLAALAYAIGGSFVKTAFVGEASLTLAIGQQLGATVVLLPFAMVTLPNRPPTMAAILGLLGLALVSTAVAYLLYFRLIAKVGPTRTLSVGFLIPAFGVVWGALFLHEPITTGMLVGMAIVLASVVLVIGMAPLSYVKRGKVTL